MKLHTRFLLLASCATMTTTSTTTSTTTRPTPIATRLQPITDVLHGQMVADPYRWLEDEKSTEVQSWMAAQDKSARDFLGTLPERESILSRLRALAYIDTQSGLLHRGTRYFYARRLATREKAIVCWKEGKDGAEQVLFDPNTWSEDGSVSLGTWSVSWDGKTVAYAVHRNNSDEATLHLMDVASGKKSDVDTIEGAKYAEPSWTPAGDGFYYTWLPVDPKIPVSERPGTSEIRFHRLGENPRQDRLVHARTGDPSTFLSAGLSRDGRFLFIEIQHGWNSTDVYYNEIRGGKEGDLKPLSVGRGSLFEPTAFQGKIYARTNDGAARWRVVEVDPAHPEPAHWKAIVPERSDATLDSMAIIGGHLVIGTIQDASSRLEVRSLDGRLVNQLQLPAIGSVDGISGNEDEDEAFFAFESFTVPREIYSVSISRGTMDLWFRPKVPLDSSTLVVEQIFFNSKDGTRVPMFVVHKKDLVKDGSARTMLWGYGGFQIAETPTFRMSVIPWIEHGGVFALANIRGGSEYGEDWHRAGMGANKQNVFDDFAAAAQTLIGNGTTKASRLTIVGRSNGGLLMGALTTQHPELFGAVICGVPLLDMVRYTLFGSGKTWAEEYGSPDDAAQFKTLYAYSPYHHVKAGVRYPPFLMLSADSDDRVDPMHARKFAAALQAATTGGPVVLRIEKNSGHGGADMLKADLARSADELAFAMAATAQ